MGGLEAPAPWQALRLCPGGFPEAQGRVSPAQTGPGRIAVDRSPADNQQPPPRHLDQGCALPRTGAEAGGGSLCPFYRQGAPPPTPAVQKASRDSGVCARRERDSAHPASGKAPQKVQPSPQSATAGVGGGGCGAVQRVRPAHRAELQRCLTAAAPGRSGHPHLTFFLGRLCLSEPPANAHPEPPRS